VMAGGAVTQIASRQGGSETIRTDFILPRIGIG
jgi:hypothetical protein